MHQLHIQRDGYAAHWVCSCGWTTQERDPHGHHIEGSHAQAIRHATTHHEERDG